LLTFDPPLINIMLTYF